VLVVCFEVYDFNGDGYISREEMFTCLKKSMVKQTTEEDPDEGIKDLVELALKKMVHNFNIHVTYLAKFLPFLYSFLLLVASITLQSNDCFLLHEIIKIFKNKNHFSDLLS